MICITACTALQVYGLTSKSAGAAALLLWFIIENHPEDHYYRDTDDCCFYYRNHDHATFLPPTSHLLRFFEKSPILSLQIPYLVKDYCISNNPDDADNISALPLAKCIDQYIDDPRLKTLAKASAWLGNDEAHYIKKHPSYGISKLKAFINAFVSFVEREFAYKEANDLILSNR